MYTTIKLFFDQGLSVDKVSKKLPSVSKGLLYQYYKKWRLEKYRTSKDSMLYHTPEYNSWREAVFIRDGRKCVVCGYKGSKSNPLQADHILAKSLHPDKMYDVNNGRTLCLRCHKKTETYGRSGVRKVASTNADKLRSIQYQPTIRQLLKSKTKP